MRKVTFWLRVSCAFAVISTCWCASGWSQDAGSKTPPAAMGGLLVSPQYVLFDGREHSKSLLLTNRGNTPETYRISIIDRRQMPDGQLVAAETPGEGEQFASGFVRFAPREVVLTPGKPQTVRLLLQMPADQPEGEYHSHILMQQVPAPIRADDAVKETSGLSVAIRAVFGVSVPLVIRRGNLAATASLSDLRMLRLADDRSAVAVKLNRSGSRSLRGDLAVLVDGQRAGQMTGVSVFLSTPYREVIIPLSGPGNLKGHRISVEFSEAEEIPNATSANQTLTP